MARKTKRVVVKAGERLDHLAYRIYGDPAKYPLLLAANPRLDVWDPKPGMVIEAPDAK